MSIDLFINSRLSITTNESDLQHDILFRCSRENDFLQTILTMIVTGKYLNFSGCRICEVNDIPLHLLNFTKDESHWREFIKNCEDLKFLFGTIEYNPKFHKNKKCAITTKYDSREVVCIKTNDHTKSVVFVNTHLSYLWRYFLKLGITKNFLDELLSSAKVIDLANIVHHFTSDCTPATVRHLLED